MCAMEAWGRMPRPEIADPNTCKGLTNDKRNIMGTSPTKSRLHFKCMSITTNTNG